MRGGWFAAGSLVLPSSSANLSNMNRGQIMIERVIKVAIVEEKSTVIDEQATTIEIVDEGAGEFVQVSQTYSSDGKIGITKEEWPLIKKAVEHMLKNCKD